MITVSLIITTYNWKEALELSILSALQQVRLPDEIIVADDGSSDGTGDLIGKIAETAPIPIIHSWQEDKGFRAAKSRNKAIAQARGDYIILVDGDILLEKHFILDHLLFARRKQFVQGSRVLINLQKTQEILLSKNIDVSLFSNGIGNRKNCIRSKLLTRLFSYKSLRVGGIKTCNFAFWKDDALAVNGFNEDFIGWGREDSEFAVRLRHSGVMRSNLKFSALAYHLFHRVNIRDRLKVNDKILENAIKNKLVWCQNGISRYLE